MDSSEYSILLENPRRRRKGRKSRRRASSRRRSSRRRRRVNPFAVAAAPRRRRRSRRGGRRRSYRRNPFSLGGSARGLGGQVMRDAKAGLAIFSGDVLGETFQRLAEKATSKVDALQKMNYLTRTAMWRVGAGILLPKVLAMVKLGSPSFRSTVGATNIAVGLLNLTRGAREKAFGAVGLSDYETVEQEALPSGDVGETPYGVLGETPRGMLGLEQQDEDDGVSDYETE